MSDIHPLVTLLLERMQHHPEEFLSGKRWEQACNEVFGYGSEEECEILRGALRTVRMDDMHHDVMRRIIEPETDPHTQEYRDAREKEWAATVAAQQGSLVGGSIVGTGLVGTLQSPTLQNNIYANSQSWTGASGSIWDKVARAFK